MFARTSPKTIAGVRRRHIFTKRSYQEVQIPVPWGGHIAGKWWGPEHRRPILALHGWQDNSGTFDTLIPQLPKHIPVLALDFPGHGHSSCLPPGMPYNGSFNKAILLKRLAQYFGWKKLSLMGHSLGAITAYIYTILFPGEVDFLICLDGLYPITYPNEYDRIANCIELFIKYDELNDNQVEPPAYTYAELEKKMHQGSHLYSYKSVDLDCAKYLLARNLKPSKVHPGKFYFKRDPRVKAGHLELHNSTELVKYASRVECPVFIARSEQRSLLGDEVIFRNVLAAIKRSQVHEVPGTHHVHLNQPEVIVELVNDFIENHDLEEERSYGGIKAEIKVPEDVYDITLGGLEEKIKLN